MHKTLKLSLAGICAGAINGFFGGCGGMVLVPMLGSTLEEEALFPASLAVMVPICLISLILGPGPLPLKEALPYLLGSFLGGLLSVRLAVKPRWLHRGLGLLIFFGGVRLCFL